MKEAVKNISFRKEMKEFGRGIRDKSEAVHFVAFPARKKADITFGSDYIRHIKTSNRYLMWSMHFTGTLTAVF